MPLTPDIPATVPDAIGAQIEDACERIADLTVENRQYALDRADLPDDKQVQTDDNDLPYVVDGDAALASSVAVAIDDSGPLAMGSDYVRIAVELNARPGHVTEEGHDLAGRVYDAMAAAGIERPTDTPTVGVQFGDGVVAVENEIHMEDA